MNSENNPPLPSLTTAEKRHLLRKIAMGEAKNYVLLKETGGSHQLVEMPVDVTAQMRAIAMDNQMSPTNNPEPSFTGYKLIIGDEEIDCPLD